MKLPVSWLRDWVDIPWDAAELSRRLTASGFEVEGTEPAAPAFTGVVVAEIVSIAAHPEADKLRICQVNTGSATVQIVCGAANARAGLKAPLAQVGAVLPGDLKIKAAKLRGVESLGMLCSAKELGLAATSTGLLELPADAPVGRDIREYLTLDDVVLELKVYANRGDSMSILGVAREIAALTGGGLKSPAKAASAVTSKEAGIAPVVQAPEAAPRLLTRRLTGLNNQGTTPLWMQERLRRAGLRSINPAVDVTNYVLLELGQPMHAYDARRVQGALTVRLARAGEQLTLLDERTLALEADMLVIADDGGPIGLAGIMGGQGTSITTDVTDVLLEVAYFDPDAIAGRGRRHGIMTDASQRFERGVDPEGQHVAMERATALLLQLCGGQAAAVHEVKSASLPVRPPVRLRRTRLALLSGADIADARVAQTLTGLGMQVAPHAEGWLVTPPSWRFDIAIEADLIEEVLRIVGFDAVQEQPRRLPQRFGRHSESRLDERAVLDALVARGYQETLHYAFVDPALQGRLFQDIVPIRLANPIAADLAVMRVSLWPGLLKGALENLSRQQDRVRLMERGAVFLPQAGGAVREVPRIAGISVGARYPEQWGVGREAQDFFDIKADVTALLDLAGNGATFTWEAGGPACLHPGRSATVMRDGQPVGWLGELHPSLAADLGVSGACNMFELNITEALAAPLPHLKPVSRFPQVRRDLSVTVPRDVPLSAILNRVSVSAGGLLRELKVFDVYQGAGIEPTRKSIAFGLIFQDNNKTLKDDDADALMTAVAQDLATQLDARVRN